MVRGRQRPALVVAGFITAAAVALSGCSTTSGGHSASAAAPRAADAQKAAAAPALGTAKPGAGAAPLVPAANPQLIAYSAQLSVRAKDVAKAVDTARGLTTSSGGYVAGESVSGGKEDAGGPADARLTLKVPSASYQQTLDRLSALGTLVSRASQADDLTQQVVDVDSRLKSQQASVDRVRALMNDAKSLPDIVSLESELSRREADLESLQRQQQELSSRTSLSTVTLELYAENTPVTHPAKQQDGFWHAVGGALAGGWSVLGTVLRGLLVALAAVAPFLLVLAPLGWMAWRLQRRRTKPE